MAAEGDSSGASRGTLDTVGNRMIFGRISVRKPYGTELEFFRRRPDVAGYAADDDCVVLNPFADLSVEQRSAVAVNEAARIVMSSGGPRPTFDLTEEQRHMFVGYGQPQDIKETVAARLFAGDPSAGKPTQEQVEFVDLLRVFVRDWAVKPDNL